MPTLGCRFSRPSFRERGDFFGEPVGVDEVGIEVIRDPLFEFGVALVFGIVDCREEFGS